MGFRALKGVGWQWQPTRRTEPTRVARHWLVLAVALLWVLAYGTRVEEAARQGGTGGGPPVPAARPCPQPPHGWSTPPGQPVSAGTEWAAPDAGPWVAVASPVAYPRTLAGATAAFGDYLS